jgi:nitroimidazol reductase NimA-like FMN-containing flavoprotein (pyridoxamine 5'-phosphate oxidase superfamily)
MTTPRTELDARFSEPAAQPTSWEATLEAIKQAEIFWISTVRADGRPHVTPLVAVWLDDALHFSTGPDEQKARNLANNPRVALTTGANDWQTGLDVVVEGDAARVTDAQQLDRLAAAWAQSGTGDGNTRSVTTAFDTTSGPPSCSQSAQRKSLPSPRAVSATPDIASEAPTPHTTQTR